MSLDLETYGGGKTGLSAYQVYVDAEAAAGRTPLGKEAWLARSINLTANFKAGSDILDSQAFGYTVVSEGQIIRALDGSAYEVAASDAEDHHDITANDVKVYEAGPHFSTRARLKAAKDRGRTWQNGTTLSAGGQSYTFENGAAINGLPAGLVPRFTREHEHFGAVGDDEADDTAAVQAAIDGSERIVASNRYRLTKESPTGSGSTNPDDAAILVNTVTNLSGGGYAAAAPNAYKLFRVGTLPIEDADPKILGGGFYGLSVDGGVDTDDATVRAEYEDLGNTLINASDIADFTFQNLNLKNSPDYFIGLQNGRHVRPRIRDVVGRKGMNDAFDQKNNYSRARDGSMLGLWAEEWGRGTNLEAPYAGVDLMAPRWVASHIWVTNFGDIGSAKSGIRLKQGEDAEARGLGAYKAVVAMFHVDSLSGGDFDTYGVHSAHRRSIVGLGTIEGTGDAGVRIDQERATLFALDIEGAGMGVQIKDDDEETKADHAVSAALRVHNSTTGFRLARDYGTHFGFDLHDNTDHIDISGDYNLLLGSVSGTGTVITDTGTGNLAGIFKDGVLGWYRGGVERYRMGDIFEQRAAAETEVARWTQTDHSRALTLTTPAGANAPWKFVTNDTLAVNIDGSDRLLIDSVRTSFTGPVKLQTYTVANIVGGTTADVVFVSNGDAGQPCLAVRTGIGWLRVPLGAAISAT